VDIDGKLNMMSIYKGHEYLEMKNSAAAIHSYRNAVEIDPKDFRAWYGLG